MVALLFPLIPIIFLVLAFSKNGLESLSLHPILVTSLPVGLVALGFWVKRYYCPALKALRNWTDPISVGATMVEFFGRSYPLSEASSLLVEDKKVSLLSEGRVLAVEPTFFITHDDWH
ncbi:MAG: hypothetical protein J0I69_01595 [Altererythrobacter sp.]|nr:hypothetical protein [Altererythrobacter sp.]